jgi:DivIVA domain-containing protein
MLTSAEIRSTTFSRTRWREGYDPAQVDEFLGRAAAALNARSGLTAVEVINARFQPTNFREGYDQSEVDDLLDRLVEALR